MKILFTRFPLESAPGGAEKQTMWLAAELRNRGHSVSFLGSCPVLLQDFSAAGFAAQSLEVGPPPVSKWTAFSFLWRKSTMKKKLIAAINALPQKPDAIFMLSLSEKILLTDHAVSRGIKVFWIEHDRIGQWLTKNPWLPSLKKASKNAMIIAVSDLTRTMMIDIGFSEERVKAVPNGVPFSTLKPSMPPPPAPPPSGERGVLHVGVVARLSPEKGIDVLIHSLVSLPEINLTIVGQGKEEGYIRTLIAEDTERVGQQRITLMTRAQNLQTLYASFDVFVLPSSEHDPFGLVAAEAMEQSIPTVVTDACGIAGYLEHRKDALIVEAGSPDAMTQALTMLSDPALRQKIGEAGAATVRQKFSLGTMADAYEEILKA